jgi:hypothetical protein
VTKLRAPLTFENALTRAAATLGWARVAEICGQAERTVRNWSEPDTTARITLEASLELDVACLAAGGEEAPFFRCYATRLDLESLAACPGREQLLASAARAARESGEAVAASLTASHPSAGRPDYAIAERELEEAISAYTNLLAALKARRQAAEEGFGDHETEVGAMVPAGVGGAQPMTV